MRLHYHRSYLYRQLSQYLVKNVKTRTFCSTNAATETNEQFRAAVLHPKKTNLSVETLILPDAIADGMVSNFHFQAIFNIFVSNDFCFSFCIRFALASIIAH